MFGPPNGDLRGKRFANSDNMESFIVATGTIRLNNRSAGEQSG